MLAFRSKSAILITLDRKNGPLLDAYNEDLNVIFLYDWNSSNKTLKKIIIEKAKLTS